MRFTGRAVKKNERFQLCYLVRFASHAVIDSYWEHPAHVAFAERHFHPYADDRISIDYQEVTHLLT